MTAMRRRAIRRFGALLPPTNHPIVFTYLLIFIFAAVAGAERFPAQRVLDAPDSAGEPLQAPPDPESRQLYAHVLPKPFNWAVFESVANLPGGNDRNFSAGSPDPDLVLTFLALRGKSIGKREPPIALKSFYRKQKDFANDPRKPPVISLPSGDGLGSPESTIGWAPFALIEYEDSNKDGKWDPRDKVVRRVELADLEFDRIVRGSLPDADTSAEPIPSPDYYEPFEVTPDPAADANILSLSSSTLSRLHAHLSLSLLAPHSPVEHEGHLALHPKSTLLRLALGTSIRKNTRIALETYLLTSRRNENKTRVAIWSAESKGWLLTNGAGSESPEVAFLGLPAHAESNGTEIPIFLNVGDKLGKKELETVLGKLPKVAARSLSQYPGITGHRVVLSFGGQPTDSILLNATLGLHPTTAPYPLDSLLPSRQHGPPFTHTKLWSIGSIFLFAGLGMAIGSAVVGMGRRR